MTFRQSISDVRNIVLSCAVAGIAFTAVGQLQPDQQQQQQQQQQPQQQQPQPQQPGGEQEEEAEIKYSDSELDKFVGVVKQVIPLQKEKEEKMVEEIKGAGLTVDRFNEIMQSQQGAAPGQQQEETEEVSEDEKSSFEQASQKVETIQQELQSEVEETIEEGGLSLEKYQEMMMAYQQDPNVQQKVNELMSM